MGCHRCPRAASTHGFIWGSGLARRRSRACPERRGRSEKPAATDSLVCTVLHSNTVNDWRARQGVRMAWRARMSSTSRRSTGRVTTAGGPPRCELGARKVQMQPPQSSQAGRAETVHQPPQRAVRQPDGDQAQRQFPQTRPRPAGPGVLGAGNPAPRRWRSSCWRRGSAG